MDINNDGGFLTIEKNGETQCLGYLMDFGPEHGVHDAELGRVDVTSEQAVVHNKLLDAAVLKGLDNCKVGQGGTFYVSDGEVATFIGTHVATPIKNTSTTVEFAKGDMFFKGRKSKDAACIFMKRTK